MKFSLVLPQTFKFFNIYFMSLCCVRIPCFSESWCLMADVHCYQSIPHLSPDTIVSSALPCPPPLPLSWIMQLKLNETSRSDANCVNLKHEIF